MDIVKPSKLPHPEDGELVPALQAGEEAAFEAFVRRFCNPMYYVALRLLGNDEDTREVMQEAFLNAFRGMNAFSEHSKLSTWLHRIVVNCSLQFLKKRSRVERSIESLLPHFTDDEHHDIEPQSPTASVEELMQRQELNALVYRRIQELPEMYKMVVLLRDIEGYSSEDTAEILETSAMVVKTRLHRARQALRTLLEPDFREGRHELP